MNEALVGYLRTRRSIPSVQMGEPGPDAAAERAMLEIAARVPDHGKLAPWRFVVYGRESRDAMVAGLARIAQKHPDEKERRMRGDKIGFLLETPLIIGVISAPVADHPKIPVWEQQLSAGAVCINLIHAAQALGFAAQWLTGWFAYDEAAARWLGVRDGETLAGFIHIGTAMAPPVERDRPDVGALTRQWSPATID